MSIPRITGREARDLLDGTTPGPWEAGPSMTLSTTVAVFSHGYGPVAFISNREGGVDEVPAMTDGALAAAAPTLAATVAWLYGREPDGPGPHFHRGRMGEYDQEAVASHPDAGVVEVYAAHDHGEASAFLTPDEAVDLARALIAAAEEARP